MNFRCFRKQSPGSVKRLYICHPKNPILPLQCYYSSWKIQNCQSAEVNFNDKFQ